MKSSVPFNLLIKPIGSACNLRCDYCFYIDKYKIVSEGRQSPSPMSDELLEISIKQYIESQPSGIGEIIFSWQGGEPLLLGIDFFRKVVRLQKTYAPPGVRISNSLQTNGTLVTKEFARFFKEHSFLVGISIDGSEELHDKFRKDRSGNGSFSRVMKGYEYLKDEGVDVNILTSVNSHNSEHPHEVYAFLTSIGATYIQFIPIGKANGTCDCPYSVGAEQWGSFLCHVFDLWKERDIGKVFVQHFDMLLARYMNYPATLCVHAPLCGRAIVLEHNGKIYSCDHFVDHDHELGNITKESIVSMLNSEKQIRFGRSKIDNLSMGCKECEFLPLCFGGCLRNRRERSSPSSKKPSNYLCDGYRAFYAHTRPYFSAMAVALRNRKEAKDYIQFLNSNND
ncbi:anaerobic sulfatase maturase [Sediminispirochaeta smaragdinae]|uniref:Radical SAM domain protein n=1 Tax=Sediminispirochaeta smaragdinae (strain DSM 11293 / JCM 15392 / SEBR 4228) TaxID=573413 RepID=E1RBQ9_SEDSS|nr:anaerobic sulfatase maturase [Sediminispirochaeta smaragdinae]ADK79789.1 Radical SAM domain protein [Sediminispirochaeta smaragdinae DSM 11293]